MTNALINLDQPAGLPAHLQGFASSAGQNMVVGGGAFNRIGLKGSRFRLIVNGQEELIVEDNFLDVIIVGASPGVSRLFYQGVYDPETKTAPTCYSTDGITPNADVVNKQSGKCQMCPQNQIGSRVSGDGRKTRACGFFKRLAVALPSAPTLLYRLDAKGMTIFADGKPANNKFSLAEYGKKLNTRGIDPCWLVTRLTFNTDESVPVVLFSPSRYLEPDETAIVADVINGGEVERLLEITSQTVDLSGETTSETPATAAPPAAQAPGTQTAAPVAAPPPVAAPAAVQAPPATTRAPATAPAVTQVSRGPAPPPVVKTVIAAPPVAKATPPRTAAPATTPAAAVAVPAHAPPATVVAVQDSDDEGLAALIARLET